MGRHYNQ